MDTRKDHAAVPTTAAMGPDGPACLLEIAAHSLKIHTHESGHIRTLKHPYDLGDEVYETGRISPMSVRQIVDLAGAHEVRPQTAVGTSVARDAMNPEVLKHGLQNALGIELHVLSCLEEAWLLARGYMASRNQLPSLILDIGGGSIETAYLTQTRQLIWDCLPLGVIRLHHIEKSGDLRAMEAWIDSHLKRASIVRTDAIIATGGTVKTIAKVLGKTNFGALELAELEARVLDSGPPAGLKPDRARVFVPGVILVHRLLEFTRADRLSYLDLSVGRQVLEERLGAVIPEIRCDIPPIVPGEETRRFEVVEGRRLADGGRQSSPQRASGSRSAAPGSG